MHVSDLQQDMQSQNAKTDGSDIGVVKIRTGRKFHFSHEAAGMSSCTAWKE